MATIDVLAPSNWVSAAAQIIQYGDPGIFIGWSGSGYHSDGRINFTGPLNTSGIRINGATFTYTNSNLNTPYIADLDARLKVTMYDGTVIFDGTIQGETSQEFSSYDETLNDIDSVIFSSCQDWSPYMYVWISGSYQESVYLFDLTGFSFTYDPAAPPYLWRDYVNTNEEITA